MLDNIYFENNIPRNFALLFLLLSAFVSIMLALIQHRKKQIDDNSAKPATPQWLVAILVLLFFGGAWVVLVHQKSHHDYDDVRDSYHKHATTDTAVVKNQVSKLFGSIYHDLRTIAALTSVRNIDSKLPMIDSNAHETIQQLYNSLHDEAKISEIYIVQADINPDAIDPRTKKPQEPHFMFDSMIGGRTSRELTGEDIVISDNDAEEVEIHEYRALREQMAWIKEHYPTRASFKGKNVPMLSSKPVITCDNSHYNRTRDNKDRTGIIFSVPIYSLEGKFQGTVSAILLQNELQAALPDQHYTLINQTQDYIIASKSDGQQTLSAQAVAEQKPDSNLIYSEITSIDTPDVQNQWALWVGLPNSRFVNSDAISSVRKFEYMGYAFALFFTVFGVIVWLLLQRGFKLVQARNLDLEHRLHLEEAQRSAIAAKEAAENTAATKSEFLANMSHELRTPLNSILGMLRLIKESGLNREQFTLADTAFRSSTNLLEIINDILDLSKIDAGGMKLERIGFDPRYVLKSSVDTLEQLSKEKRIPIVSHFEHEAMPYVLGDPTRMGRIFINLISNAIKYTDRGHVDISASCIAIDDKYTVFRCEVKDTGIGIPENKRAAIFEKFVQADTSTTRKYGGTGLGLAITRELVEMMGGKIGVDSVVGLGSTFWISIPFETTPTLHKEKQIRREKMLSGIIPPADARILIAEDHIMNQLFMKKLMQNFGITHYKIVASGTAALKAYIEKPWDVILMDCHMPEKNGYDTTIEIRELEKQSGKHIPIIAMTANAISGDREKCLRVGMDEYMSKPIDIDTLKETLGQWIRFEDIIDSHDHTDAPPAENDAAFDLSMLQNLTGGDKAIEKELIEAFIAQSDENIAALEKTQNSEAEHAAWAQAAHMLKGGAANLGAKNLIELCEKAQHFNGNLDEKTQIFAKISSEYKRIKAVLSQMGY